MRACIQRVSEAGVAINGKTVARIDAGMLVLLGVARKDTQTEAKYLADKIATLRVFEDADGKMNLSLGDIQGAMLVVSQFTLLGDASHGRRPSYTEAAEPALAEELYEHFVQCVRSHDLHVETGRFRQNMQVSLVNDGPVTLFVESRPL